jgi:hypothetical protein
MHEFLDPAGVGVPAVDRRLARGAMARACRGSLGLGDALSLATALGTSS